MASSLQIPSHTFTAANRASPAMTNRILLAGIAGAFLCQLILLVLLGWHNRDVLSHTDGILYMRIASYYARGEFDLAVSGYWSPLYSWLIAPLLGFVEKPLYAARIVMGLSAVVFLSGAVSIFRSLDINLKGVVAGSWITAITSIPWSVETNNPDLLMGGFVCLAVSRMCSPEWLDNRRNQIGAGIFWAMAYYSKAVAFPVALITSSIIAFLWGLEQRAGKKLILRNLAITQLTFLSVASIWIIILSLKFGGLIISTSGKINHAIVGPPDVERYHTHFSVFHAPEPGRITVYEDPSNLHYEFWSPLQNLTYAKHQLGLICSNAHRIMNHLMGFSSISFGVLAIACGLLMPFHWRQNQGSGRWRWAGWIVAGLVVVYLPVYALDRRYYYQTLPFLVAASFGLVSWLTPNTQLRTKLPGLLAFVVVILCFVMPAYSGIVRAFSITESELLSLQAYELAKRVQGKGLAGSIAGGSAEGLYIAFTANQPSYGGGFRPSAEKYKRSNAQLIVVHRNQPVVEELDYDASFRNLDGILFDSAKQAGSCPLKVYQLLPAQPEKQ